MAAVDSARALRIDAKDNVATVVDGVEAGDTVVLADATRLVAADAVPAGHKLALDDLKPGAPIIKYGEPIGVATRPIRRGALVHVHNVASQRGRGDLRA